MDLRRPSHLDRRSIAATVVVLASRRRGLAPSARAAQDAGMTENRFAVPLEQLDGVRVAAAEQVQERSEPRQPSEAATWGGLLPAHLDGGGGGTVDDGD